MLTNSGLFGTIAVESLNLIRTDPKRRDENNTYKVAYPKYKRDQLNEKCGCETELGHPYS